MSLGGNTSRGGYRLGEMGFSCEFAKRNATSLLLCYETKNPLAHRPLLEILKHLIAMLEAES